MRDRSIEVLAPDEPVRIRGARDYLFRALRNIVENALRHTPEGTTVSIVVEADPPSLKVIDHGPGVPRIRGMRSSAASGRAAAIRTGGAGLGLDIAARTVVAHGGIISVDEAPEGRRRVHHAIRNPRGPSARGQTRPRDEAL